MSVQRKTLLRDFFIFVFVFSFLFKLITFGEELKSSPGEYHLFPQHRPPHPQALSQSPPGKNFPWSTRVPPGPVAPNPAQLPRLRPAPGTQAMPGRSGLRGRGPQVRRGRGAGRGGEEEWRGACAAGEAIAWWLIVAVAALPLLSQRE